MTTRTRKPIKSGQRFGRLVAQLRLGTKGKQPLWLCLCDCGREHTTVASTLYQGQTKSCGCYRREFSSQKSRTHGHASKLLNGGRQSRTYKQWAEMKARCQNKTATAYPAYGARGITVCERWNQFQNFLDDMGPCPPEYSIDRIDNSKGYFPENCRWATWSRQCRNRSSNRMITINGEAKCMADWADFFGINYGTVQSRLRAGLSHVEAVSAPLKRRRGHNIRQRNLRNGNQVHSSYMMP